LNRSRSTSTSTNINLESEEAILPTDGLLSKAKRRFFRNNSNGNYGTNTTFWSADTAEDSDEDESGLYSSAGSSSILYNKI